MQDVSSSAAVSATPLLLLGTRAHAWGKGNVTLGATLVRRSQASPEVTLAGAANEVVQEEDPV